MSKLSSNIWKFYATGIFQNFWFILSISILFYQKNGLSYTDIGILEFFGALTILFFEIPTGAVADIIGRKKSLFLGTIITSGSMILIGLSHTLFFFITGFVLWSIGDTFISGARQAIIYDSLKQEGKEKEYMKVMGRYRLYNTIVLILSTFVAPFLFILDIRLPYLLMGVMWFISSFFILLMEEPEMERLKYNIKNHYIQMKEGLLYSLTHKLIRWLFLFSIFTETPMIIYNTLMTQPYYLSIGFSVQHLGIITSIIYGLASLVSSQAHKIEKGLGEKTSLFSIALIHTFSFIIMGLFKVPLVVVVVILLYMSRDFSWVVVETYINDHTPSRMRATILSIWNVPINTVLLFAYLLSGYLVDMFGLNPVILFFGIMLAFSTTFLFSIKPKSIK